MKLKIDLASRRPKYEQIVDSIMEAIQSGKLKKDQRIPSINEISEEYYLSRDTVEKAYSKLREKGLITSVKGKGYYICRTDVGISIRVLLFFNKISNYKKQIYNSFVNTMGPNAVVDLQIHHFNTTLFRSLVTNSLGSYDYYVIMPHFYDDFDGAVKVIESIPPGQLILLDKKLDCINMSCSAVYQDFEKDIFEILHETREMLDKYKKLILVFSKTIPHPPEIKKGFILFCKQNNFDFDIIYETDSQLAIDKGDAFIVIEENDLVNIIKKSRSEGYKVGEEIGILSYNETPLKEILLDGITVISTDHEKMGETAAQLILEKRQEQIKNPFKLIKRMSL